MKRLFALAALLCSVSVAQVDQHGDRIVYGNLVVNGSVTRLSRGTTLPGTCTVGDFFFDTDATPGQNLYGCTAFGVWTLQAGGGGGGGISQLNGLTAATQTFATANDTNITVSVGSTTATHTITVGFTGTLAKARQHAATAYTDGSYANPAWITSLDWSKLTSVPSTFAPSAHAHAAADTTSGIFSTARLGTGTPGATNFLRGDGAFAAVDYSLLTGVPSTFTPSAHNHAGTEITSGLVPSARLAPSPGGTGATCLGDNQTWVACGGGGGGEANTASNLATGIGLFASKVGVDLRFKSILAGSSQISVTANGSGNTVDIDLVPGNVVITSLSGWPAGLTTTELGYVDGVTSAIQTQLNTKAAIARTTVSFSATPTFTRTEKVQQFVITLTGNVTSSTLASAAANDILIFEICQDATGGRTFVWPTGFTRAAVPVTTASACSFQAFVWDGSAAKPVAGMTTDETGVVVRGATVAALGTPASGSVCWLDSTAGGWSCKDSSGNVTIMPRVEASATANQFVTHIPASGVPAKAQPAFSNLSGTASDAQIPNLNTLSTGLTGSRCVETDASGLLTVTAGACAGSGGGGTVTSVDASGGVETASGSAVTTSGTIRASMLVNAQTGTTYTIVSGDRGKLVTLSNASAIAVTLPQAGGTFPAGWYAMLSNIGTGTVTVTPTTSTISGAATITLETGEWALITSDGTNYNAVGNRITAGTNVTLTKSRTGVQIAAAGGGGGSGCTVLGATGNYLVPGAPGPLTMSGYGQDSVMSPTGGGGANQSVLWHVFVPCAFTPNAISFNVTTAGGAGCRMSVGLYDNTKSLIISSGVLEDSATTVQCDTTGVKTLTGATSPAATGLGTERPAGWYWISTTANETTSRITGMWVTSGVNTLLGGLGGGQMGVLLGAQVTTGGALNSSWTTGSGWSQTVAYMPTIVLTN